MTYTTAQPGRPTRAATARRTVTLTGVQPTGDLHLGNYAGAIRPLAGLAADPSRGTCTSSSPICTRSTAARIPPSCASAPGDSPPHCSPAASTARTSTCTARAECRRSRGMAALLGNVTAKGLLNRAHAYKAAVAANVEAGRDPDHGVNMGLYGYPVLMAADILALDADEVPVGADQAQHLEIAVDLAQQFSRSYRPGVLREPRALITEPTATLPGLDGRKMSKSYDNTIPLMADPDVMTPADPADRHRLHAAGAAEGPRHVHARRAAACLRRPEHGRRRRGALPHRRHRLRRGQGAARRGHRCPRRSAARPLPALLADPAALQERLVGDERHAARRADEMLARR